MSLREHALERAIAPGELLALDASATLAYLGANEAASPAATWVFDFAIATGRNPAIIPTVTAAELLVRPFRAGSAAVGVVEGFLRFFGLRLMDVTFEIGREAARIRAVTGMSLPDAIVVASAADAGAGICITNDRAWPKAFTKAGLRTRTLQLADYVTEDRAQPRAAPRPR